MPYQILVIAKPELASLIARALELAKGAGHPDLEAVLAPQATDDLVDTLRFPGHDFIGAIVDGEYTFDYRALQQIGFQGHIVVLGGTDIPVSEEEDVSQGNRTMTGITQGIITLLGANSLLPSEDEIAFFDGELEEDGPHDAAALPMSVRRAIAEFTPTPA